MMAPLMKKMVLVSAVLFLAACGGKGGSSDNSGGAAPGNPNPPAPKKLQLKSEGVKTVLVGAIIDLRKYVLNYEHARFEVVEGQGTTEWADPNLPKLHFKENGKVTVIVSDTVDHSAVAIQFNTTFDTTGIVDIPGGPDLTLPGGPGFP